MIHIWRLHEAAEDNLGLAVTREGLVLGGTPLIEKSGGRFVVRNQNEIERLLKRAYRTGPHAVRLMPGLKTVAAALNANDPCLARIAAVHLKIPDLPDRAAREEMEAEDTFIRYARQEADGDDWDPALHPRTGAPPNPGWFAPTDGSSESSPVQIAQNEHGAQRSDALPVSGSDWFRLRPGPQRIDELADFVEWMANAKPADEQAIRGEIKRYFYDVGDQGSAHALNSALTVLLRPGITQADRQKILDSLDIYTRADPAEYVQNRTWTTGAAILSGALPPAAAGEPAAGEAAAGESTAARAAEDGALAPDATSEVWKYGWAKRGREIHDLLANGSLGPNFPTIDMISRAGIATSIKSIDLNAAVYQNDASLAYRLNNYFDKVSEFDGAKWAADVVSSDQVTGRVLNLVVPKGSMSESQRIVIERARVRAENLSHSVDLVITPF
jgi:hypothetical protein